jgi:hypothetical protein
MDRFGGSEGNSDDAWRNSSLREGRAHLKYDANSGTTIKTAARIISTSVRHRNGVCRRWRPSGITSGNFGGKCACAHKGAFCRAIFWYMMRERQVCCAGEEDGTEGSCSHIFFKLAHLCAPTMLRDDSADHGRKPPSAFNVLGEPLEICSFKPMTGFYRDGCCNTGSEDIGSHTVCVVVTAEFLVFWYWPLSIPGGPF